MALESAFAPRATRHPAKAPLVATSRTSILSFHRDYCFPMIIVSVIVNIGRAALTPRCPFSFSLSPNYIFSSFSLFQSVTSLGFRKSITTMKQICISPPKKEVVKSFSHPHLHHHHGLQQNHGHHQHRVGEKGIGSLPNDHNFCRPA